MGEILHFVNVSLRFEFRFLPKLSNIKLESQVVHGKLLVFNYRWIYLENKVIYAKNISVIRKMRKM